MIALEISNGYAIIPTERYEAHAVENGAMDEDMWWVEVTSTAAVIEDIGLEAYLAEFDV